MGQFEPGNIATLRGTSPDWSLRQSWQRARLTVSKRRLSRAERLQGLSWTLTIIKCREEGWLFQIVDRVHVRSPDLDYMFDQTNSSTTRAEQTQHSPTIVQLGSGDGALSRVASNAFPAHIPSAWHPCRFDQKGAGSLALEPTSSPFGTQTPDPTARACLLEAYDSRHCTPSSCVAGAAGLWRRIGLSSYALQHHGAIR